MLRIPIRSTFGAPNPAGAARNLVGLLEGLTFTHVFGAGVTVLEEPCASLAETLRDPIRTWIDALIAMGS